MFRRAASTLFALALVGISMVALTQWASGTTFNPQTITSINDNRPSQFPDRTDTLKIPAPDSNFSLVVTFVPPAFCVASIANDCSAATVDSFGTQTPTGPAVPLGTETGTLSSLSTLALSTADGSLNTTCNQIFVVGFTFFNALTGSPGPILHTMADGLGHDGAVDLNGDGVITAADTTVSGGTVAQGSVSGRKLINGLFDVNGVYAQGGSGGGDGVVDANDNGLVEYKKLVIAGQLDANGDGVISAADDGLTIDSGIVSADPIAAPADPLVIQWQDPDGNGLYNGIDHYPNYLITSLEPAGAGPATAVLPRLRTWGVTSVAGTSVILQFLTFNKGALVALTGLPYTTMTATKGYPTESVLQDPDPYQAGLGQISDFCTALSSTATTLGTSLPGLGGATGGSKMGRNPVPGLAVTGDGTNASLGGIGNTGTHFERQLDRSYRDADSDGIENEFDTCPNTANIDGDPRTTNGPDSDGLDSACDPGPNTTNYDQDGDGWANRIDNCPLVANATPGSVQKDTDNPIWFKPADGGPPTDGIGDACDLNPTVSDGHIHTVENKVGICVGGSAAAGDNDINDAGAQAPDGWCNARETFLGTNPLDNCGGSTLDPLAWPPDFNGDRYVNTTDKTKMALAIKAYTANNVTGYNKRFDLDANGAINSIDKTIETNFLSSGVPNPPGSPTGPQGCLP